MIMMELGLCVYVYIYVCVCMYVWVFCCCCHSCCIARIVFSPFYISRESIEIRKGLYTHTSISDSLDKYTWGNSTLLLSFSLFLLLLALLCIHCSLKLCVCFSLITDDGTKYTDLLILYPPMRSELHLIGWKEVCMFLEWWLAQGSRGPKIRSKITIGLGKRWEDSLDEIT